MLATAFLRAPSRLEAAGYGGRVPVGRTSCCPKPKAEHARAGLGCRALFSSPCVACCSWFSCMAHAWVAVEAFALSPTSPDRSAILGTTRLAKSLPRSVANALTPLWISIISTPTPRANWLRAHRRRVCGAALHKPEVASIFRIHTPRGLILLAKTSQRSTGRHRPFASDCLASTYCTCSYPPSPPPPGRGPRVSSHAALRGDSSPLYPPVSNFGRLLQASRLPESLWLRCTKFSPAIPPRRLLYLPTSLLLT